MKANAPKGVHASTACLTSSLDSTSISVSVSLCFWQSFTELQHRPQLVDLTVEEGQRLKVIYGSSVGFHVIDVDSGNPYDIYIPSHVSDAFLINLIEMQDPFLLLINVLYKSLYNHKLNRNAIEQTFWF